jgi:hypothetical protein
MKRSVAVVVPVNSTSGADTIAIEATTEELSLRLTKKPNVTTNEVAKSPPSMSVAFIKGILANHVSPMAGDRGVCVGIILIILFRFRMQPSYHHPRFSY